MTHALVTLGLAAAAAALAGGGERAWGIGTAWLLQTAAAPPLNRALRSGRSAINPWLAGIALRAGGLVVTGGLVAMGAASSDLPLAYVLAMLALLWAEAIRLARSGRSKGKTRGG